MSSDREYEASELWRYARWIEGQREGLRSNLNAEDDRLAYDGSQLSSHDAADVAIDYLLSAIGALCQGES